MDHIYWIYPTVTLISELMTNNETHGNMRLRSSTRRRVVSLQCAVCTLALATVRAESSCGAARCLLPLHLRCIATPRPTLHWSA